MTDSRSSERVYDGKILKIDLDHVRNPAGVDLDLEIIRHPGASAVVPVLSDPHSVDPTLLLIRQFRYAAGGTIWEIPAGVLEPEETPEECARRELLEETGATSSEMRKLTTIFTTPGFTDERIHLFAALRLKIGEANHQPDECIEVARRPLSVAIDMIEAGEIMDAKSIVGILLLRQSLQKNETPPSHFGDA